MVFVAVQLPIRCFALLGIALLFGCTSDGPQAESVATTTGAATSGTGTTGAGAAPSSDAPSDPPPPPSAQPSPETSPKTSPKQSTAAAEQRDAMTDSEEDREAVRVAEEIQGEVEKLRGLKFVRPVKKGVYDKERLAKFLEREMSKEHGEQEIRAQQSAFRLFGLVPPDYDLKKETTEVLLEQIGGFYDADTRELYVMRGFTGFLGKVLMAHELCHALDDQHFDLKAIDDGLKTNAKDEDDRMFAAHAVMEGSA